MTDSGFEDDPVALLLASKAFAAQVLAVELGEFDAKLARADLIQRWARAGSPPGAFLRTVMLALDLPTRLAQADLPPVEDVEISREDEIAAAQRAAEFLEQIALDFQ